MRSLALALLVITPAVALADEAAVVAPSGSNVALITSYGKSIAVKVGSGKAATVHKGMAAGALVTGHDKTLVAVVPTKAAFFVVPIDAKGKRGEPIEIERPGERTDDPFAVVGTATEDGFAIFFQEVERQDPSAAHTYLAILDADGKPKGAASEVQVPWALAAAIDNGPGYHLALIYPGDGMRISMVSLDASGTPQQHPDWASPPAIISQVTLFKTGEAIHALYRGGKNNDRILELDVTTIGQWGQQTQKPTDHGAISSKAILAVDAKGNAVKVSR